MKNLLTGTALTVALVSAGYVGYQETGYALKTVDVSGTVQYAQFTNGTEATSIPISATDFTSKKYPELKGWTLTGSWQGLAKDHLVGLPEDGDYADLGDKYVVRVGDYLKTYPHSLLSGLPRTVADDVAAMATATVDVIP